MPRLLGPPAEVARRLDSVRAELDFIFNISVGFVSRYRMALGPALYTLAGPAQRDDIFIGFDQAGIGGHEGDLDGYLGPLPEGPQGPGHDFIDLVGAQLVSHRPPHAPEGMLAREHAHPGRFEALPHGGAQFLDVGSIEAGHVGDGDDPVPPAKHLRCGKRRCAAYARNEDPLNAQCPGPSGNGFENIPRVAFPGLPEVTAHHLFKSFHSRHVCFSSRSLLRVF